jgi:hypothetical protein
MSMDHNAMIAVIAAHRDGKEKQAKDLNLRALTAIDLADEFEHEARGLRAKGN